VAFVGATRLNFPIMIPPSDNLLPANAGTARNNQRISSAELRDISYIDLFPM